MKNYQIEISGFAKEDLEKAADFYDTLRPGLGDFVFDSLLTDLESLRFFGGIHPREYGLYRMIAKRFPYNRVDTDRITVVAILDRRSEPLYNYRQVEKRNKK